MQPTRRAFWILPMTIGISLGTSLGLAQRASPAGRWIHPGGGNQGHGGGMRGGHAAGSGGHAGGSHASAPGPSGGHGFEMRFSSAPTGSVTDPSFAGRLGRIVGGQAPSGATRFGNINHPGIQPLPTGSGFPIPNINHPGAMPGIQGDFSHGKRARFHGGFSSFGGFYSSPIIYYGVPYYYPVYTQAVPAAPPALPEPPREYDIRQYQGVAPSPAQPSQQYAPQPPGRTVTLLAFKDATVIAVTDYWLQGDSLVYETSLGVRTVVPLDRLDLALTQQLNFERNVRFVLEARP